MQLLSRREENEATPVLGVSEYSDETSPQALLKEFLALILGRKVNSATITNTNLCGMDI